MFWLPNEIVERRNVTDTQVAPFCFSHTTSPSRIRTAYFFLFHSIPIPILFRFLFLLLPPPPSVFAAAVPSQSPCPSPAATRPYTSRTTLNEPRCRCRRISAGTVSPYYLIKCDHRASYLLYDATAVFEFICFPLLFHCNKRQFIGIYRQQ